MPAGSGSGTSAFRNAASIAVPNTPIFTAPQNIDLLYSAGYYTPKPLPSASGFSYVAPPNVDVLNRGTYQPLPIPAAASPRIAGAPQNVDLLYRKGYTPAPAQVGSGMGGNAFATPFQQGYQTAQNSPGSPIRSSLGSAPVPTYAVTPIGDQTSAGPVAGVQQFLASPVGLIAIVGGVLAIILLSKKRGR